MAKTKAFFSVLCAFLVVAVAGLFVYRETLKNKPLVHSSSRVQLIDIEYEDGLGQGTKAFQIVEKSEADQKRYRLLKKIWQKNRPLLTQNSLTPRIPKIIHQIWLGPRHIPSFFPAFSQRWKEVHPDWEYRLWTDADLNEFDFELRDLFEHSTNYGEKADILRCEILLKYGGLYVDTDFECIQPFDELLERYDFFAGIEPPHIIPESDRVLLVSDAIIGTVPGHPILLRWRELIRRKWYRAEETCFNPIEKVLKRTFFTFGQAVEECIERGSYSNVIFPSTYFYPIKPTYLRKALEPPGVFKKILYSLGMRKEHGFSSIKPETLAIHHFAGYWQKSNNQIFKEMHREIIKLRSTQLGLIKEVNELRESLKLKAAGSEDVK